MTSPPLLNLSLDQARQARRFDKQDVSPDAQPRVQPLVQPLLVRQDEAVHELDPEPDLGVESARGELRGTAIASVDEIVERPYPLCLLCLARPPSAVLLPCELVQHLDHGETIEEVFISRTESSSPSPCHALTIPQAATSTYATSAPLSFSTAPRRAQPLLPTPRPTRSALRSGPLSSHILLRLPKRAARGAARRNRCRRAPTRSTRPHHL
jgi:hypothetical protein